MRQRKSNWWEGSQRKKSRRAGREGRSKGNGQRAYLVGGTVVGVEEVVHNEEPSLPPQNVAPRKIRERRDGRVLRSRKTCELANPNSSKKKDLAHVVIEDHVADSVGEVQENAARHDVDGRVGDVVPPALVLVEDTVLDAEIVEPD